MSYGLVAYGNIDDHINNVQYPVEVQAHAVAQSVAHEQGELEPFFVPRSDELVRTRMTIADMVDMCHKQVMFVIAKDHDTLEIYTYLQMYTRELSNYSNIPEVAKYIPKAEHALQLLRRPLMLAASKHADIAAAFRRLEMPNVIKKLAG